MPIYKTLQLSIHSIHQKLKKPFFIGKRKESTIFYRHQIIFRSIFTKLYPHHEHLTPYMWLPKWCGEQTDPSARVLNHYKDQQGDGAQSK